jgi:glutamyl-tRNA reductase
MPGSFACPHQDVCSTAPAHVHFHAVAAYSGLAALRVLTINHRNVGLDHLAALSLGAPGAASLHEALSAAAIESVVLATCNRTELYWRARVPGDDERVTRALAQAIRVPEATASLVATRLAGEAAVRHLFGVCCGLESLVIGEAEILGQVRAALEACTGAGAFLEGVFRAALRTGRAARAETGIGTGAVSVASTAINWLAELMPLPERRVLVVGAGDTAAKAARQLRAMGAGGLAIANRTVARAEALAANVAADAMGLDALPDALPAADALVVAARGASCLVTLAHLERAAARRAGRPLVVVDLAMPCGVEPGDVDGVRRIDLRGLEHLVEENRHRRQAEVPRVQAVIERELEWLRAWARHQALRPLVADLRRKVEAIRRAELARAQEELVRVDDQGEAVLDRLSRRLLEQVLAIPLATLEAGDLPLDATHAEYLRRLFALDAGRSADVSATASAKELTAAAAAGGSRCA